MELSGIQSRLLLHFCGDMFSMHGVRVHCLLCNEQREKIFQEHIVGIPIVETDTETEDMKSQESDEDRKRRRCSCCPKSNREKFFGILLCLIGSSALTVVGVVIFQNCILVNQMVTNYNDESCPEYIMDCFIINLDITKQESMNITVSFQCKPWDPPPFPSNQTNITAHCFRWGPPQSKKDVLYRLGISTGLLGLFSTLLAMNFCLGPTRCQSG